ncbi:unannotated protein [freshwater metagenome]|uniref:Unannotated protein n=1 Tax=freshwater metagenome TaxID=449393 RepID=A0A6J7W7Q5_9ZZZZ
MDFSSRAFNATADARLPPALSPPTPIELLSIPNSVALSLTHFKVAKQSSNGIGNGCSGAF